MISLDTNLLLYAFNSDCPEHERAAEVMSELARSREVVLCELVLVELYLLLRNAAVIGNPLRAEAAVAVCRAWRSHPHWRLVDCAPVMGEVWNRAGARGSPAGGSWTHGWP